MMKNKRLASGDTSRLAADRADLLVIAPPPTAHIIAELRTRPSPGHPLAAIRRARHGAHPNLYSPQP